MYVTMVPYQSVTPMALFHCMVRYGSARFGTAQFGSVCVSTAV